MAERKNYSSGTIALEELFEKRSLRIPDYQRPYSWDEELIGGLWSDLSHAAVTQPGKPYFIGSMVMAESPNQGNRVIDGQQRLLSLTLILLAIRYKFQELNHARGVEQVNKVLYGGGYQADYDPLKAPIKAGRFDMPYLTKLFSTDDEEELYEYHRQLRKGKPGRHKDVALWKNYAHLRNELTPFLRKKRQRRGQIKALEQVVKFLNEQVLVSVISVTSESEALDVFESLNDKRLELSSADLVKLHVFDHLGKLRTEGRRADLITDAWECIPTNVGSNRGTEMVKFLRAYYFSRFGHVQKKDLSTRYRDEIRALKSYGALKRFVEDLGSSAKNYGHLVNGTVPGKSYLNQMLGEFKSLGMSQHLPLLLSALDRKAGDGFLYKVISIIDTLAVRVFVASSTTANQFEREFARWSRLVNDHGAKVGLVDTMRKGIRKNKISTVNAAYFQSRMANLQTSTNIGGYILRRLESHRSKTGVDKLFPTKKELHVEHIYPKTHSSDWDQEFCDPEQGKAMLNRLGNLTLLTAAENKKVKNKRFRVKREVYRRSGTLITREVAQFSSWSPSAIERRQLQFGKLAPKVWQL